MEKKTFFYLAVFTLVGFSLLGYVIIENFLPHTFEETVFSGEVLWKQLVIGTAFGYISAIAGWKIIETNALLPVRTFFSNLIQNFKLSISEILFISICAGIGEEILFRGAIQPLLGIWITAILFVAIHGYLNPMNWRLTIYGGFMTIVIAGIGYMTVYFGLISAIAAHIVIDIVLLFKLSHDNVPLEDFSNK